MEPILRVKKAHTKPVLRIHLILIRIQVIFQDLLNFFLTTQNFIFFVLFYSLIFMLELDQPFRNEENFIISIFAPWIRIFLRIRTQEAKILQIQRIRILSTAENEDPCV